MHYRYLFQWDAIFGKQIFNTLRYRNDMVDTFCVLNNIQSQKIVSKDTEIYSAGNNTYRWFFQKARCPRHQSMRMGSMAMNYIIVFFFYFQGKLKSSEKIYFSSHLKGKSDNAFLKSALVETSIRLANQVCKMATIIEPLHEIHHLPLSPSHG